MDAKREAARLDARMALSSEAGKRFASRIAVKCGVFARGKSPDAELAAYREGARDIGIWLLEEAMRIDPALAGEIVALMARKEGEGDEEMV